jgi:alpha/beta superfamily hydrolase
MTHAPQTSETILSFVVAGQTVVGTLSLPAGDPAPVVLLLHGFSGTRDELEIPATREGIFTRTARLLADAGYASLRIDFRGSGDSDGDFADTTYSGQIADATEALHVLKADPRVARTRIALIGWSQGGLVASAIAGRTNIPVATALWAAVGEPEVSFRKLVGAEHIASGLKTGQMPLELPMPWGMSLYLKQPFFDELVSTDPLQEIAAYRGPLFVAEGDRDESIPPGTGARFIAAHPGQNELWGRPMDHIFNTETGTQTLDEMIAATLAFFNRHL